MPNFDFDNQKLHIVMFSSADTVAGQGVGSAYQEQVKLISEGGAEYFDVDINKWNVSADIQHFHTIDPVFFLKIFNKKSVNVAYCHFLPDSLEGYLKIPKLFVPTVNNYVVAFYQAVDRLIVVNPSFIDAMVKYGIDRDKIYYIPNYVDHDAFCEQGDDDRRKWRAKYGIKDDDFVVMACGQVHYLKGVLDFVEIAKQMPDVKFVWAGGFSFGKMTVEYDKLKEAVDNPPENVIVTGIVDRSDLVHIYNLTDVFFMPSYAEQFPMTILEAVNLSKPLVVRSLELYESILFDGYLKGADNQEFIELIRSLKEDPQVYEKAVQNAQKIADYYSKENVLKMWRAFYEDAYEEKFGVRVKEPVHEA